MTSKLIIAAVKPSVTDRIVIAAKAVGATGATIIPARGTGVHEAKTFFGLTLEAQTDVVLFLLPKERVEAVLSAIVEKGGLDQPGVGIAFVMPVDAAAGLESQLEKASRSHEGPG